MPSARWAKNQATGSGRSKRVMLRMPTSTADTVTHAFLPASAGTFTVTGRSVSGFICPGASIVTSTLRSPRSIGTCATPTARAGVVFSAAEPPRSTSAVT